MSGFPRRDESEYDTFGTGHSSTSISAALGMALAAKLKGEDRRTVAVIGDGAMSAGMAFEALNNAGVAHAGVLADMLVVLNDNDMSISPPVGALNKHLARLMSGNFYTSAREGAKSVLKNTPLYEFARRFEEHAKGMVVPGTIFEEFGFNYVGPIDGHDLDALIPTLENMRSARGPQFLHIVTRKGQGYKLAEADPVKYHAASGKFDPLQGFAKTAPGGKPTFTQVFGQWLCDMAAADERLIGITPAMREGSGMVEFQTRFPTRYYDVGIAEQHAVTFAAGLACEGLKPVVAIYSTFLQRAYDQMIHDVAHPEPAGGVCAGPRRHRRCRRRHPLRRLRHRLHPLRAEHEPAHAGRRERMSSGADQRLPPGPPGGRALPARQWCRRGHRQRPRRHALGQGRVAPQHRQGQCRGRAAHRRPGLRHAAVPGAAGRRGAGRDRSSTCASSSRWMWTWCCRWRARTRPSSPSKRAASWVAPAARCGECLAAHGLALPMLQLGLPDEFVEHGDPTKLLAMCGLDATGIEQSVLKRFGSRLTVVRPAANL